MSTGSAKSISPKHLWVRKGIWGSSDQIMECSVCGTRSFRHQLDVNPADAARFAEAQAVDCLTVQIGQVHGS